MNRLVTALLALIVAVSSANAQNVPQIPVESVADFFRLPTGVNFGEVPAVAVNSQGHIFVYSRSSPTGGGPAYGIHAAQLFEFSPSGEFIREHGKGLYAWAFAHGLRIDANDNIWTVDKGSNMVVRMNPEGRVVWVFGRKAESSSEGARPIEHRDPPLPPQEGRFREPTDVAFDSQGNIYISDGYVNSRVAKYDMNGDWVMSWGEPGTGPGQLRTPHSIAIDKDDNVYVGDRSNARIQVFDTRRQPPEDLQRCHPDRTRLQSSERCHPDRPHERGRQRRAELALHPTWKRRHLRGRDHVPRTDHQGDTPGPSTRGRRQLRAKPRRVLRSPRTRLPHRGRPLCSGDLELTGAEADSESAEGGRRWRRIVR